MNSEIKDVLFTMSGPQNLQLFSCSRSSTPDPFQYLYKIKQKKREPNEFSLVNVN